MVSTADVSGDVVVLRVREAGGNFQYWLAELSKADAFRWEEKLKQSTAAADIAGAFGKSLTLGQIMERLHSRDFRVLDLPKQ